VIENGCEQLAELQHMTEAECQEYAANNGLAEHEPFAGSWQADCSGCLQSGGTVSYNTHPSPDCTTSWLTVCDEAGDPSTHIPHLLALHALTVC